MIEIPEGRELVFGVDVAAMPEGDTAFEVLVLVQYMDSDGDTGWAIRRSKGMDDTRCLGILHAELDRETHAFNRRWVDDADDEGDDDASS